VFVSAGASTSQLRDKAQAVATKKASFPIGKLAWYLPLMKFSSMFRRHYCPGLELEAWRDPPLELVEVRHLGQAEQRAEQRADLIQLRQGPRHHLQQHYHR
jgi:hypothetical protein